MKTLLALALSAALLVACLPLGGCAQLQQAVGIKPAATQPSAQSQLDTLRGRYGATMGVLQPLIDHNVITDKDALSAIRVSVKEVDADIKDAQAKLDAGQPITAQFFVDKVAAAVAALERAQDKQAKAAKP